MGDDPKESVTNRFGQLHEAPNVVLVDGSTFPTFPEKNPTLTLMALSVRAARHLAGASRRHEL
jgi:choline dehydrogenase-like flavoprotein